MRFPCLSCESNAHAPCVCRLDAIYAICFVSRISMYIYVYLVSAVGGCRVSVLQSSCPQRRFDDSTIRRFAQRPCDEIQNRLIRLANPDLEDLATHLATHLATDLLTIFSRGSMKRQRFRVVAGLCPWYTMIYTGTKQNSKTKALSLDPLNAQPPPQSSHFSPVAGKSSYKAMLQWEQP